MINKTRKDRRCGRFRAAGILNLIAAALYLLYLAVFFVCLFNGVIGKSVEDGTSGVGFAVAVIVCLTVFLVSVFPMMLVDVVWQIIFGLKLLRAADSDSEENRRLPSRGVYIASLVLKIISFLIFVLGIVMIYGILSAGGSLPLTVFFVAFFAVLMVFLILLAVMEHRARSARAD